MRPASRLLLAVPLTLALVVLVVAGVRVAHADRVLPGTSMAGLDLGGADAPTVRERLGAQSDEPVTLVAGEERWRVTAQAAGLEVDVESSIDRALDAGRSGLLLGIPGTVRTLFAGQEVELDARLATARVDRLVGALAGEIDVEPSPGRLRISGPRDVQVTAPRSGRLVDREELRARLRGALRAGDRRVEVPVTTIPTATRRSIELVAAAARRALTEPLEVTAAGRTRTVSRERRASLLALRASEDATELRLGTDTGAIRELVAELAGELDRPARNAEVIAPSRSVIFEDKGDASFRPQSVDVEVSEGRTGRVVAQGEAAKALAAAVRGGERSVDLPTRSVAPAVAVSDARKIDRLIGTFTTRYEPGQPRVENIARIARAIDGTVVAPGARFSLNGVAGQRTADKGYVEAPFISEGRIVPSIGGGVSQASTTVYNAAYFAGLPLEAFRAHSLYIDRYPPGREATLNFPDIDLAWTNDTGTPILVRAVTDATSITVSLFGDNDGRRVSAEAGPRVPVDGGDFAITVTRTIRYGDDRVVSQETATRYDNEVEDEPDR